MIALVGFMGAGKTTVGRALAQRLTLPFFDVDETIEQRSNATIAEVFRSQGEPDFRALEKVVVAELLGGPDAVVALGGGSVEDAGCRELLENATVVYLGVDSEEALRRINGGDPRPMLESNDPEALYKRRRALYESVADVTISTDGREVDEVVEELAATLGRLGSDA
jgi:shikimate kinase